MGLTQGMHFCGAERYQLVAFFWVLSINFLGHFEARWEMLYVNCTHKCKINQGVTVGGRHPLVEDGLPWKTTFDGR